MRTPARLDGRVTDPSWSSLPWSEDFVDITGDPRRRPRYRTRFKMGYDESCLYVAGELEEPHVWGTLRERDAVVFEDNDFELFLDPDGDGLGYYELEVNALGTVWELRLPKPYRQGGRPEPGAEIPGLRVAVAIDGTLNDPSDTDRGWSVELALPWDGLARYHRSAAAPPRPGDLWRANFSRVQWRHEIVGGGYRRVPPHGTPRPHGHPEDHAHPEDNWVWSPQGAINMHLPDRWGEILFTG